MPNTSDVIIDKLGLWGVEVVFGLPGDGINGLMEALRQREDKIRFVLVRHEESAAFMATAYAKLTGRIGVCIATSGPGGIHLLNGLYDAKLDSAPVLAITGQTYSDLIGSKYQQEVDMLTLFKDVSVYNVQVNGPEHAQMVTDLAIRSAVAHRGVAHINVPVDIQERAFRGETSRSKVLHHTAPLALDLATAPPPAQLARAATILNAARKVAILAGSGARGAHEELDVLARRLQAPIMKPLLGKDVIADAHPHVLGGVGLLGTLPGEKALEECDCLLMVGTSFPYMDHLPKPGSVPGVQIDIDPSRIGLRYPVEVGLVGDARSTLQQLLPLIDHRSVSEWLVGLQGEKRDWLGLMESRALKDDVPMKPQRAAYELDKRLRDDAIVTCDSGTIATWAARYLQMRQGQRFTLSGTLATMAPGLPYAIAAQVAYPDRQVVAFVGDGGLMMLGSELSVAAHYRLPIKVIVIKNGTLGMIKWEQMVFLGNPSYGVDLPPVDLAKVAEGYGVKGYHVERPQDVGAVLDAALAHDGPALVECLVDPFEPPHPAKVKMEQALKMAKALARGEPNATRIAATLFRDKIDDLTHGPTDESARQRP